MLAERRALSGVPAPVTVRVPGKVNLHLSVGPRRDDGFHEITTVFHAVSLFDDVTATAAPELISAEVRGEGAGLLPSDSDNLAVAAALRLAVSAGIDAGARLVLEKGIPVAGGMAGGSADAAGALVACDALWQTGLDRTELAALGATLGSDVPFALHGGTALGVGRGEQVTPVMSRGQFHWVFALADHGLSTRDVYAEFDSLAIGEQRSPDGVLSALLTGDVIALGKALHNDLAAATLRLRPALRRTLAAGVEQGALGAVVSGSGPTCAFLVATRGAAVALAAGLAGAGVCRGVRTAHGPVAGARVIQPTAATP